MIKIFCDRCKAEIVKNNIGYIAMNSRDRKDYSLTDDNEFEQKQYCEKCMKDIRKYIKTNPENAEIEKNSEESQESETESHESDINSKKNEKKPLDIGKIMALRNAGWSNKDIAAELHVEPQTIANAVYNHKKSKEEKVSEESSGTIMKPIPKRGRPKKGYDNQ